MRIAVISDVHADVHALMDALNQIAQLKCDFTFCAGDVVDYGLFPNETIKLLRDNNIRPVRGNHDRWAIERDHRFGGGAELSRASRRYLAELPKFGFYPLNGVRVAIHHAQPSSDIAGIDPETSTAKDVRGWLDAAHAAVLVVGHTHQPSQLELPGRGIVINPGALLRSPAVPLDDPEFKGFDAAPGLFGVLELPSLEFRVFSATGEERSILSKTL